MSQDENEDDIWELVSDGYVKTHATDAIYRKNNPPRPRSILKRKMIFVERTVIPVVLRKRTPLPRVSTITPKSKGSKECVVCENIFESPSKESLFCNKSCSIAFKASLVFPDDYDSKTKVLYSRAYVHALRRKKQWLLSPDEFQNHRDKPCHYCGEQPVGKVGLDRIDSKGHYSSENVVPCCYSCNMMKNTMDVDEFIAKCTAICSNHLIR